MANKRSKKEDRIYRCKKCGKVKEAEYPSHKKTFCSHQCKSQWDWEHVRPRGDYLPCFQCGKLHWTPLRYFRDPDKYLKEGKFCSSNCFYEFRTGTLLPQISKSLKKRYANGLKPWNKGKELSKEYKEKCRVRAINQWKDLNFREKQMKRDHTKFAKAGAKALKEYHKKHGFYQIEKLGGGKAVGRKYLKEKLGIKI